MKPDYKNWVPHGMICGVGAGLAAALLLAALVGAFVPAGAAKTVLLAVLILAALILAGVLTWCIIAYNAFSYDGTRRLSKKIVEGVAEYITLPQGGLGLDVGCGSGALTIACAKRNPGASMVGVDIWGKSYASFSMKLCADNARAEGVHNVCFEKGNAVHLPFPDGCFEAVTSNYVYHNIIGQDKQALVLETLRVLKKGGCFAIHDIMSPARYGDTDKLVQKLRDMDYQKVERIDVTDGKFMTRSEAHLLGLKGSTILVGIK